MSAFNCLFYRLPTADPVSLLAGYMMSFFNVHLDLKFMSIVFTLWTVGMLILSSLTNFLKKLFLKLTRFSPFDSAELSLYFVSYITGVYFVSSILSLKNSLPASYVLIISDILPMVKFDLFSTWFDIIFVMASLGSAVFIVIEHSTNNNR
jgi:hypothetical protein